MNYTLKARNTVLAVSLVAMLTTAGCSGSTTAATTTTQASTTTLAATTTTKATTTTAATTTEATTTTTNAGDLGVNKPGAIEHRDVSTSIVVPAYVMSPLAADLVTELKGQISGEALLAKHVPKMATTVATDAAGNTVVLVLIQLDSTLAGADNQVKVLKALTGINPVTQRNVGNVVGVNYQDTGQFDFAGIHGDTLVLALAPTAESRDALVTALVAAYPDL